MNDRIACILTTLAALALLTGRTAVADSIVNLRGGLGYDSNVYELNPVVGEQDGLFTEVEASAGAEGLASGGWIKYGDITGWGQLFESAVSDADQARFHVRAGGRSDEAYSEHGWDLSLRYRLRESTYVSSFTGEVATDGAGTEIGDRYDSTTGDVNAEWRLPGTDFGRLSLKAMFEDRNYLEDYEELGLERLDYSQYGAGPRYELGGRERNLRIDLQLEERVYRDRRASDLAGDPIVGTDLEYRYYIAEARYLHRFTRRNAIELKGGYDLREDNGVGYADRTRWHAGIGWTSRFKYDGRLGVDIEYSSRVYDQQFAGDPTINDEAPSKEGFDVRVRYARPFPLVDIRDFDLVLEAEWMSYDNTDDIRYAYDRMIGFVSVRKEF